MRVPDATVDSPTPYEIDQLIESAERDDVEKIVLQPSATDPGKTLVSAFIALPANLARAPVEALISV